MHGAAEKEMVNDEFRMRIPMRAAGSNPKPHAKAAKDAKEHFFRSLSVLLILGVRHLQVF